MTDKGTIIYIGGFELPDKNAAAHRVLNNGKVFRDLGYNVVFIGIDKSLEANSDIIDTKINVQGFETWAMAYPKNVKDWLKYLSNTKKIETIFKLYEDTCLLVVYNYQAIAMNRLKKYCWNHNCKLIADCTEWYSTKGTNLAFKFIKGLDSFIRMRILHKRLDGLIVISKYLEEYYKNVKNIICLPPLVDKSEDKWIESTYEHYTDRINLVYAGSLGRNKDHLGMLIKALTKTTEMPLYSFYVIGVTQEEYLKKYPHHNNFLKELKGKIIFLGRLTHSESLYYVKKANFSVFLRDQSRMTKAGFPTKFVESISCGTQVITTRNSDLHRYMTTNDYGFFINIKNNEIDHNQLIKYMSFYDSADKKKLIDSNIFDYHNFLNITNEFLGKI